MLLLAYFTAALIVLLALTAMILAIARAVGDCRQTGPQIGPQIGPRARAAGLTIATGFLALGGGAVLLIGAGATLGLTLETVFFCLGLVCIVLGLGFTQAVTLLRAVVDASAQPAKARPPMPEPAPAPVPAPEPVLEPVLA